MRPEIFLGFELFVTDGAFLDLVAEYRLLLFDNIESFSPTAPVLPLETRTSDGSEVR